MLALCRLAYEQGILTGDLNDVQQAALLAVLKDNEDREFEKDWLRFRLMLAAIHPERAAKIFAEENGEAESGAWAEPMTEEEMANYVPVQMRGEADAIIQELRGMGLAVRD